MQHRDWVNIPFAPRAWPFFYGWVIVACSVIATLMSIPGQTVGVGVFKDYLQAALGMSAVQLSTAYMLGTILSSFMLPYAGSMLDRTGARRMAVFSSLGLGAAMVALAMLDHLALVRHYSSAWIGLVVSTVVFLGLRFFGQGCLTMVARVMVGKWFNHRRGLATGIMSIFVSFGFMGSPYVLNAMTTSLGWRETALILAGTIGIGMTVIGWVFSRDNPEECGLEQDGKQDPAWRARMNARIPEVRKHFRRGEALRTPAFWAYTLGLSSQGLIVTGLGFHIVALGEEMLYTREEAFKLYLIMPFFTVPANFIAGWLSDRMPMRWLLMAMMAAQGVGTIGLLSFDEPYGWYLLGGGYGVAGGLFGLLGTVVWPRLFGQRHLGAISGMNMSIMVFASALGPVLFSVMQGITGDFVLVKLLCLLMTVALLIFALFIHNPQERYASHTEA
jgi:MFS family permease